MTEINQLVLGGSQNGQFVPWKGDEVTYIDEKYRAVKINLEDATAKIYVHESLSNQQALNMLQQEYLGI